jgi:hypothetical protein
MTKSVKRIRPMRWLDDEVFAKVERGLSLESPNEKLRNRISDGVFDYLWSCQQKPLREAAVRKRLSAIKTAARKLHEMLNENPAGVAARAAMKAAMHRLFGKKTIMSAGFIADMRKQYEQLPNGKIRASMRGIFEGRSAHEDSPRDYVVDDEREVLWRVRALVHRKGRINLDELSEKLDQLCRVVDAYKKSKGGRPRFKAWDKLMLNLAAAYEEATGKRATVTENEHRAGAGERYSGRFVRVAAIVDRETASAVGFTGVRPRPNSALGPALQRVLKSRRTRKRSKTN